MKCFLKLAVFAEGSMRLLVLTFAFVFISSAALACGSSPLSCQDLAIQAAKAAGIDPATFVAQIQAESNFNPNAVNPNSGALGIAQFLPSTAANAGFGIAPFDPRDPVAALTAAAQYDAALAARDGSLTAALTDYSGGLTPTNPGPYAQAFADAQAADAGNPQGIASATVDGGQGTSIGGTATQSLTTTPFQYAYSTMVDGVTQQIATAVQATTTLVHPYLVIALTIAAAFMGFRVMVGKQSYEGLASFAVRATIVGALLSPGSQGFMDWIEQPIMQLPSMIGAAFGIPDAGPAAIFDDAVHALSAINQTIQSNIPVSLRAIGNILFMDILWLGGVIAFAAMFLPFLLTTFLLLLMLAIAPVPILFGLFPLLDGWAKGFADVIATLALLLLAIDVVVSIIEGGIINALNAFSPGGSSQADMAAFATMVLVFGAMAASIRYLGPLIARISGGVTIAVESAALSAARLAR